MESETAILVMSKVITIVADPDNLSIWGSVKSMKRTRDVKGHNCIDLSYRTKWRGAWPLSPPPLDLLLHKFEDPSQRICFENSIP